MFFGNGLVGGDRLGWLARHFSPLGLKLAAFALILLAGAVGFALSCAQFGFADSLYKALQLFGLNYDVPDGFEPHVLLQLARFLAPVFTVIAVIELFGSSIAGWLRNIAQAQRADRVILLGFGKVNRAILRHLTREGPARVPVTVIDQGFSEGDWMQARAQGILLREADLTNPDALVRLLPERAKHIYVACGSDALNLEVGTLAAAAIERAAGARPGHINPVVDRRYGCGAGLEEAVHVHIASPKLMENLAQAQDVSFPLGSGMTFFSFKEETAAALVARSRFAQRARDAGAAVPHLVIFGAGEMAEALLVQSIVVGISDGQVPQITLIDADCAAAKARFAAHYPRLFDGSLPEEAQPQIRFEPADVTQLCFETDAMLAALDAESPPTAWIFSCRDDETNVAAALQLENAMQVLARRPAPIYARAWEGQLAAAGQDLGQTHLFGQGHDAVVCERILGPGFDWMARHIHRAYLDEVTIAALGPAHDLPFTAVWKKLPAHVRRTNLWAAMHLAQRLEDLGFDWRGRALGAIPLLPDGHPLAAALAAPDLTRALSASAETEHNRWMMDRALCGWKAGARDNRRRLHPNMIPFARLDDQTKQLDLTALRAVFALTAGDFPAPPPLARVRCVTEMTVEEMTEVRPETTCLILHFGKGPALISAPVWQGVEALCRGLARHENLCRVRVVLHGPALPQLAKAARAEADETRPLLQWLTAQFQALPDGVAVDVDYMPEA